MYLLKFSITFRIIPLFDIERFANVYIQPNVRNNRNKTLLYIYVNVDNRTVRFERSIM